MGGGWHLPYGGTPAGLSDPAKGGISDGEPWDRSFAPCTLFSRTLCLSHGRRPVFKGSGAVMPSRGQIHPLNGVVRNLRELGRGFMARMNWRLLHPLPRASPHTYRQVEFHVEEEYNPRKVLSNLGLSVWGGGGC